MIFTVDKVIAALIKQVRLDVPMQICIRQAYIDVIDTYGGGGQQVSRAIVSIDEVADKAERTMHDSRIDSVSTGSRTICRKR